METLLDTFNSSSGGRTPPKIVYHNSDIDNNGDAIEEIVSDAWNKFCYIPYCDSQHDYALAYGSWDNNNNNNDTNQNDLDALSIFCENAQIVNYAQYRAIIEAFSISCWKFYTGVLLWKANNPYPGLRGSLYDWYGEPNAGLYGKNIVIFEKEN